MPSSPALRRTRIRALAGIEQQSPAIDFKQRGESPLSDATPEITRQHRGEHGDFDGSRGFSKSECRVAQRDDA